MRISILEFDYHAEVLRNTLEILKGSELDLQVFTTEAIWQKVAWPDELKVKTKGNQHSLKEFLKSHSEQINQCDLILVNTMASQYKTWAEANFNKPVLLRVHNANSSFAPFKKSYQMIWKPFFLWKDFSHFIRKVLLQQELKYRKAALKKIDHFAFPNELIKDFSQNQYQLSAAQCWSLPFSFWEHRSKSDNLFKNEFQMSIIGKIDQRNRDYELLVKAIVRLQPQLKAQNLKLKLGLLGKPKGKYGNSIIQALQKLKSEHFQLHYYQGFVPQTEFEREVYNSQLLIIPTRIKTRFTIYTEWYGKTKISGSVNDVIRYHKPALIDKAYEIPKSIASAFDFYANDQELADKIIHNIIDEPFKEADFEQILSEYERSSIQALYVDTFQKICNS